MGNAQTVDLSQFAGPPVDGDLIDYGDILDVSIAAGLSADDVTTFSARVGEDGMTLLPEIGQVQLAGLPLMSAEQQITAMCVQRGLYTQPNVTVTMKHRKANRVTVVGAVKTEGVYELPCRSSYLTAAIVAAGGLAENAGTKVEIRHPGAAAGGVRLASATDAGPRAAARLCMPELDRRDTIPQRRRISAGRKRGDDRETSTRSDPGDRVGSKPGQYDYPVGHDLRVFGAIAEAGGMSSRLADKVYVMRSSADGAKRVTIELSMNKAKHDPAENLLLSPGDIVSVEQTPVTMVADFISTVLRFGMSASMPLF